MYDDIKNPCQQINVRSHVMAIREKYREELFNWLMIRVNSEMKESLLS